MAKACSIQGCENPARGHGFCSPHYKRWRRHGDPLGGGTSRGLPKQFIEVVVSSSTDECILWPYGRMNGYGHLRHDGRSVLAHRLVCHLVHGEPETSNLEAAHGCGVPLCVNPRHLRWATPAENNADKKLHGTHLEGVRAPRARFSEEEVLSIRSRHRNGESLSSIGRSFGIGATHVRRIVKGETYRNIHQQEQCDGKGSQG